MIRFDDVAAVIPTRGDTDMTWTKDLPYGEVIVWDNSKEHVDHKVYGRYSGAWRATRDIVYFQDDDVRFHNHEALLEKYEPGVLVSNMYDQWIEDCGYVDLAMVGLGSIMDNGLWEESFCRYQDVYPDDDRFLLDCDFIFGCLARWRRYDFGHEILDIASDDTRLWWQEGQFQGKWRTINRARALRQVTLAIMAKNEAHQITRALESAKGLFDSVTLLDTGSEDGTPTVVQDWCEREGIPFHGYFHIAEEFSFGRARNQHLHVARNHGDYILMMDADEELVGHDGAWPELFADGYLLHYEGSLDADHVRLVNRNFPWLFQGKVHSVIEEPEGRTPVGVNLRKPLIRHHGWTRHGTKKLERDIELLTEQLDAGLEVPRSLFLRGKAYMGLQRYDEAIEDLKQRVFMYPEGDEEHFLARLMLGKLTAEYLNHFPDAVEHLMMAWIERPTRAEPLRDIAMYCTALADSTPYPENDHVVYRDSYKTTPQGV